RVALFTGVHERVNGIGFTSSYRLTDAQWQQTYPSLLRHAGYYTGFIGKFGVEYYELEGDAAGQFDFWCGHDGWTRFFPKEFNDKSCTPYHNAEADIITFIMGEKIDEFLDVAPRDKPFCLSVSFNVPHGSQATSMYTGYEGWAMMAHPADANPKLKGSFFFDALYRDLDIPIPRETGTDPYRFIPKFIMNQDQGRRNRIYPYSYSRTACREHHIRYYQTISGMDFVIGNMLADLEQRGVMDNTIIIFASDHGLLMGEYGMGGKALLYDLVMKIPCFVYDPRLPVEQRGSRREQLVSSLDLTATLLDYAGIERPEHMSGRSLRPLIEGRDVAWRNDLFLENLYTGRDTPFQEGIRTSKWKYIRMFDGRNRYDEADIDFTNRSPDFEILFDLDADPDERNNLVESHDGSDILASLRRRCAARSQALNEERRAYKEAIHVERR
ncbi:MAG: sulfatase-like hydrolase/transferase, partial [Rhodospirillales bacterium]|nr:sulfatase-like hydrolase/transferase [Rhodospirillales bacterium]